MLVSLAPSEISDGKLNVIRFKFSVVFEEDIGSDDVIGFGVSRALVLVAADFDGMVAFSANVYDSTTMSSRRSRMKQAFRYCFYPSLETCSLPLI